MNITCFAVKTEKKTVQFSDDVQVETIEPEPEQAFIDEVSDFFCESGSYLILKLKYLSCFKKSDYLINACILCYKN